MMIEAEGMGRFLDGMPVQSSIYRCYLFRPIDFWHRCRLEKRMPVHWHNPKSNSDGSDPVTDKIMGARSALRSGSEFESQITSIWDGDSLLKKTGVSGWENSFFRCSVRLILCASVGLGPIAVS